MKQHWKILLWMAAGVVVGGLFQLLLDARATAGIVLEPAAGGLRAVTVGAPASKTRIAKSRVARGDLLVALVVERGKESERRVPLASVETFERVLATSKNGDQLWFERTGKSDAVVTLDLDPGCERALWLAPFVMGADVFIALLKMLIVPLVLTSIVSGVAGVGALGDLRRFGLKTIAYYVTTSMLAIFIGQALVNTVRPGVGAQLGLPPVESFEVGEGRGFADILLRMIPENLFGALAQNGQMLAVIFFGLLFGACITVSRDPHKERMRGFFESAFEVMMRMAELVLKLIPYGVFCLLIKVVGRTGFGLFEPLAVYMIMITVGLTLHAAVVLPLLLKFVGHVDPFAWAKTMGPALMTAFSASSSSMTLPVTMECVEKRGGVSNKISSFVLPLGATINMDGTALYECAGVIFLAQYYQEAGGFELTFGGQAFIVVMALFASIGAAGIPSAGLVMMLTILAALGLPLEGAALLLAVDRPLDMLRTVVNVWSDSCGTAIIASSEGERPGDSRAATRAPRP